MFTCGIRIFFLTRLQSRLLEAGADGRDEAQAELSRPTSSDDDDDNDDDDGDGDDDDGDDDDDNDDDDNDGVVDHSLENVGWRRHEVFTLGGH